jgi:predicted Zn-dependent protease
MVRAAALLKAGSAGEGADALPPRRPELFIRAQLAMQGGQAGQISDVAQRLQVWVLAHPHDAQAWQLLSSASAAQGQTLRAIRADAEAQMARLDYPAALERFKAAQELMRQTRNSTAAADHIDASIIDTRRRQAESLAKEQALER